MTSALSFMLRGLTLPVVLTGSQLPAAHPLSDAPENLRCAFEMAATGIPGVFIAFDRMVDGIAEFTRDFPGEVWLEVFLLAGVNDGPVSVESLAALTRRIGPARVQLNTVSRPPTESSALAPSHERMRYLLDSFPGQAELVHDGGLEALAAGAPQGAEGGAILALLGRRPCTSEDVANGLGIHRLETLKVLDRLIADGEVRKIVAASRTFYTLIVPGELPEP